MPRMLTSEMADRLLTVLVNEAPVAKLVRDNNVAKLLEKTGLEPNELDALLDEFRDCGLIKEYNLRNNVIELIVTAKASLLLEAGGFSGQLSTLRKQLQLLEAELKNMPLDNAAKVSGIVATVLNLLQGIASGLLGKY